jgi:cycloartenol synthase
MVDYSYVECSSACMTALCAFRRRHPEHRTGEVLLALGRGREYIESIQRSDGSWCAALQLPFPHGFFSLAFENTCRQDDC